MSKLFKIENIDSDAQLHINTDYANNYNNWRRKEELHRLKALYGENTEPVKSSEEFNVSSEDDEGKEIPEQMEKNFYKTLAYLKNKDPKIYDQNVQFFTEHKNILLNEMQLKEKKEKSLFLRDYERKIMVEKGGNFSDSENETKNICNKSSVITYAEEQKQIKETFKKVLQNYKNNQTEDVLLIPKIKTKEETQKEKKDYKEWLEGHEKNINEEEKKVLKPLRDFWTNPNLDENEKFLRDYILHKKFLDKESTNFYLNCDNANYDSKENLSEDEYNINQQEEFEYKYNFRFEEPDQEFIKRYPRTLENSLRKKNTRRAEKRIELKIRKRQENIKKQEALKQLKALKRKEIEEKLQKLKEITGNNDLKFNKLDLEEDFDPDKYDMKMSQIFNDEYYTEQKDAIKPEFPDLDRELSIESSYDLITNEIIHDEIPYDKTLHCEDAEFNMDADYDGKKNLQTKLAQSNKKKKKSRCKKFVEMISKEKPKFDPTKYSSYKQYYNQYYDLDYEDIIEDLPCRFKYRQVIPNDYGLTIEEILMADDRELNKWCPLRKAFEYKSEYKELNDVKMYKQKANNEILKRKILKSLYRISKVENDISVVEQREEQNITRKHKCKRKTQELEQIISTEIKNKYNINIKKLSKNKIELDKLIKQNKIKKYEHKEILNENIESKLVSNKNKMDNKGNKLFLQHSQSTVDRKQLNIEKSDYFTKQLNKIYKTDNFYKQKSKNLSIKKNTLNKKNKRTQKIKKSNKKMKVNNSNDLSFLSFERLKAYGVNPKKFINKIKYLGKN